MVQESWLRRAYDWSLGVFYLKDCVEDARDVMLDAGGKERIGHCCIIKEADDDFSRLLISEIL